MIIFLVPGDPNDANENIALRSVAEIRILSRSIFKLDI